MALPWAFLRLRLLKAKKEGENYMQPQNSIITECKIRKGEGFIQAQLELGGKLRVRGFESLVQTQQKKQGKYAA